MVGSVLTLLAGIFLAGEVLAQQSPALARLELSVTLTGDPADPLPELRAAPGIDTPVFFDADLNLDTLEVDRARIQIVGTGPRFIIFTPVVRLGADMPAILRVRYADGRDPTQAVLTIVSHPSEVHTRVEVVRRPPSASEACEPRLAEARAQCAALSPTRAVRAGLWGDTGVISTRLPTPSGPPSPAWLSYLKGWVYSTEGWGLVKVEVRNALGQPPWRPREARLSCDMGTVQVRSAEAEPAELAPGATGTVFVEYARPEEKGRACHLAVRDGSGRSLALPEFEIPKVAPLKQGSK
jgi:uncharacterized protein (TIGR02268 family)